MVHSVHTRGRSGITRSGRCRGSIAVGTVALGLVVSSPMAGAAVARDGSSWVPVAANGETLRIAAFDVRADRGIVVMDTHRAGGARFAVATFRRDRSTGAVRTGAGTLGLGPSVVLDVVSDRRGGWIVLTHPTDTAGVSRVTRVLGTGRIDTAYGSAGSTIFNVHASTVAVDPPGRTWAVGSGLLSGVPSDLIAVTRLARTGALDPSYGVRGTTLIAPPRDGIAHRLGVAETAPRFSSGRVAVGPSGGVVIAGTVSVAQEPPPVAGTGFLTRLDPSGALDSTFGRGGVESYGPIRPVRGVSTGWYGQALSIEPAFENIYVAGVPALDSKTVVWKRTARGSRYGSFINHGWLRLHALNQLRLNPLDQTSGLGATCNGGLWIVDTSLIQVRTRAGRPDRRFAPAGQISLRGGAQLRRLHASSFDPVGCRVAAAQIGVRGRTAGIVVRWFATPTR